VSDKNERIKIETWNRDEQHNFGGISFLNHSTSENAKEIELVRVDDDVSIDNVSVIKIDVEGMETQALSGSRELITRCRPAILFETWDLKNFEASEIARYLKSIGYKTRRLGEIDFIMTTA
jgi:FkbM family methyltransferase